MPNVLDLKRLRYFQAIAAHGSLSAAARALNLAQPALSHHVTQIEVGLGTRVLERHHDGVELTEAGRVLLRHAVDIATRVERAEMELTRLARAGRGRVKIRLAVIASLAADLTPILVAALARDMPEVVPRITEAGTLDSRDLLERGEADLAIHLNAGGGSDTLLATERLHLVSLGAEDEGSVPFADVARQHLILPAQGNPLRGFVEQAAARSGLSLDIVFEIDGAEPRRQAVLAGLGATILGAHSVESSDRKAGLSARPIVAPELLRPIYLGARRGLDPQLVARIEAVLARSLEGFAGMDVAPRDNGPGRD